MGIIYEKCNSMLFHLPEKKSKSKNSSFRRDRNTIKSQVLKYRIVKDKKRIKHKAKNKFAT